jgi:DNA-binding NarL/FixJ family response regulator
MRGSFELTDEPWLRRISELVDALESDKNVEPSGREGKEPAAKPRVVIADDHRLVAAGLEQLIASDCDVVGSVYDGKALLDEVRRLRPDVVLVDLSMPPLSGVDLIREIVRIDAAIRIVVVTMWDDPDVAAHAFRAGAAAYVLKNCAASELLDAVRSAMMRKSYVTPLIVGDMIRSLTKAPEEEPESGDRLTARQMEVLRLLAAGKSMKEVAADLNLTVRTVAFHKYRMMSVLHLRTTAELIRFAVLHKLV